VNSNFEAQEQGRNISLESIFKEGQLHARIAELSQVIIQMAQELDKLRKDKGVA
jgi:hypothetical protein